MGLNAAFSTISFGLGLYSLTQESYKRYGLMAGSALFWTMGFAESFTTSTWDYLQNIDDRETAIFDLNRMVKGAPTHTVKITNFY
jgi:hypothetical protein